MKRLLTYGPFLIGIAAVLWAVDGILRRSLYSLPPITIVFFEHLIGALLIAPFFVRLFKREKLNKKEWGAMWLVSLFSGVLGTLWFTTALLKVNFIPFSVVFLLQKLQPVFTIGIAAIVLKERVSPKFLSWAILAIAAAYFVTFPGGSVNLETGSGTAIAALYALGAAFVWASTTAFSRFTLLGHSNTFVTGMRFFLTVPLAFLLLILMGQWTTLTAPTSGQFLRLLIIALSTGMVAVWIYYRGLKTTRASVSTIVELIFPVSAVLIDIFIYDTVLSGSQYFAAAVLLFAVYNVSKLNKQIV